MPRVDHVVPGSILLEQHVGTQGVSDVTQEWHRVVPEHLRFNGKHDHYRSFSHLWGVPLTVKAVPVALLIIAAVITVAIAIVPHTVSVIVLIARLQVVQAVEAIVQAVNVVALWIAAAIPENFPALDGSSAVHPRIDAQRTVTAIKVASVSVALFITVPVASFLFTASCSALFLFFLQSL